MRRPALAAAVYFATGVLIGHRWSLPAELLLGGAGMLFLVAVMGIWGGWGHRRMGELLGCLFCVLGTMRYEIVTQRLPVHHLIRFTGREGNVEVAGAVAGEPEWVREDLRVLLSVEQVVVGDSVFASCGEALIRFRKVNPKLDYGDWVRLRLRLRRPSPARNPGAFDYRDYLKRKGIYGMGRVRHPEQILEVVRGGGNGFWKGVVLPVRRAVRRAVDLNLSGGPAGLLKGVLLGEKRGIPEEVREAFTRSGVNHVLAVSGLHVGLIAASVFFGLRTLGIGRRGTSLTTVGALLMYALVTGLPPSVIRASTMGSIAILGTLGDREGEGLNTLGTAGLVLLAVRPQDLFDVGFQLSFAATGAILLFYRPIRAWMPGSDRGLWGKWICTPLAVSLAAQAGTAPFVATYFGHLASISLLANLIVVPLMGAAVALGLLSVLCYSVFLEPIATLFNGANWAVLKGAIGAADLLSRPTWAFVEVPKPAWVGTGLYFCLLMLIVPEVRRQTAGRYLVFCCLGLANLWVWSGIFQRPSGLEVVVLDVGQGDGVFLRFPNGRTMMVDGGLRTVGIDVGERVLVPFLRERGIRRIDIVVASHPHSDHIGGLVTLLERFEVGHYLDGGQTYGSWTARRIRTLIRERGIAYQAVAAGDSLVGLGGAGVLVLHPTPAYVSMDGEAPHGLNNGSVVLRITFGGKAVLLTGDIEHETDRDLLRWEERLRAEVLKAAHHGSRTSSTAAFLAAVRPQLVTVSCGVDNKFGHPAPEVIRRYEQMGLTIFRTDKVGAIQIVIDGEEMRAEGWLTRR